MGPGAVRDATGGGPATPGRPSTTDGHRSALYRDKWDERRGDTTYGAATIDKALAGKTQCYTPPIRVPRMKAAGGKARDEEGEKAADERDPREKRGRLEIEISPERHLVVDEAIRGLAHDTELYWRGESLVTVARSRVDSVKLTAKTSLRRMAGAPRIIELSDSNVGCVLTQNVEFVRIEVDKNGEPVAKQVHPPDWAIKAVATRKHWPGLRQLVSVVECPYPRADGSIVEDPGYDHQTGTLYVPSMAYPRLPDRPTREDAVEAWKKFRGVFREFPFASEDDEVVPLATLLTMIGRPAIDGPVPGTAVVANKAGSGKGLLINSVGRIAYDRDVPTSNYPDDPTEAAKVKVSIALQAPIAVHFDNLAEGSFYGNSALDSMITAGSINDRILGSSKHTGELPVRVVPMLSGNNVSPGKDAHRRWLVCNLATELERPEERDDLEVKDLKIHISGRRGELVQAALTILKAHALAGRLVGGWAPLGSFEEWDTLHNALMHFGKGGELATPRGIGNTIRGMKGNLTEGMKFVEAGEDCRAVLWKVDRTIPANPEPQEKHESDESPPIPPTRDFESHNYVSTLTPKPAAYRDTAVEHSSDSSDSSDSSGSHLPDSPAEEDRLGILANRGMSLSGIRSYLDGARTHSHEMCDLLPRIIAGGMWRDFVFSDGARHRWGAADFRAFLEAPRSRGGCESSLPLIERLIGGTAAWAALQAVIESGDDETPPPPPDAGRLIANGKAIRGLVTALSLAEYTRNIPKMFVEMVREDSWRKYLTRGSRDENHIHRRDAADFRAFLEAPWPGGLGSSLAVLERVLRDTEAWPVYRSLIERDGGLA